MGKIYERSDIYDLMENESKNVMTREHYETVFHSKTIHTLLDVSIGSGGMTLPIADMGIKLYGSDLSQDMLDRCQKKCAQRNIPITLKCSDFRTVSKVFPSSSIVSPVPAIPLAMCPTRMFYWYLSKWTGWLREAAICISTFATGI